MEFSRGQRHVVRLSCGSYRVILLVDAFDEVPKVPKKILDETSGFVKTINNEEQA